MNRTVAAWLDGLQLSAYAPAFTQHDIDGATLPLLTGEDLEQIGVTSVGHRRRMLEAIAALGREPAAPGAPPPKDLAVARPPTSERRQITIMFCDLVGSTILANRLDPEDLHDLLLAYRTCITEAVRRHQGFIAHFVGDGVFIYFGYPHAQERDAERAIRAGLAIIGALAHFTPVAGVMPQVRIGVATGRVVIGQISDGAAEKVDVAGDTPNLAARLQDLAGPNEMIVAGSTRALVGDYFNAIDLGCFALKGLPEPVPAWRVTGERAIISRYDAMRGAGGDAALIGRESELVQIGDRLAAARAGSGQVVLVLGQAGLGKSRLVAEMFHIGGAEGADRIIFQCSPDQVNTHFYPLILQLEYAAGVDGVDQAENRRDKVEAFLSRNGIDAPDLLVSVFELLRIEADSSPAMQVPKAGDARARTLNVLIELAERVLSRTPVMVIEDVHWADPATLAFLDMLVALASRMPALIVATARPGFHSSWLDDPHVTALHLERLSPPELHRMIEGLPGADALPADVLDRIVARSDGVPLFAQELIRGSIASERRPGGTLVIPATLAESLLARLDGLDHGRQIAQIAAVIGREFSIPVLVAVSPEAPEATLETIGRLIDVGLFTRRQSSFGEAAGFSHMLIRDAAYDLLLRRDRTLLHGKVAQVLEQGFPEMEAALPQLVAHHFAAAGEPSRAADYWRRAGADAAARSMPLEAVAHYREALEIVASLPEGPERGERELGLRMDGIGPLITLRGHGSADVAQAVEKALDLHRSLGSSQSVVPALTLKWLMQLGTGDITALCATARQIKTIADGSDPIDRLLSHRTLGSALMFGGELAGAVAEFLAFFELYHPASHDAAMARSGSTNHCGVAMLCLAECYGLMGAHAESARWRQAALSHARDTNHAPSLCQILAFGGCWLADISGDAAGFVLYADELRSLVSRHDIGPWRPHVDLLSGLSTVRRDAVEQGFAQARQGIDALVAVNAFLLSTWVVMFIKACEQEGRIAEAAPLFAVAEARIAAGERWLEAEILRYRARLRRANGEGWAAVRADLEAAAAVAAEQGAMLLHARAVHDLTSCPATLP